jgi:hypothetical protein
MSCGCGSNVPVSQAVAAMCHVCPWAEHGPSAWRDGAVACTIDGKPMRGRTTCPRGVWSGGLIRWLGVKWRGVPMPIRWIMRAVYRIPLRKWVGCGCLDRVKRWTE